MVTSKCWDGSVGLRMTSECWDGGRDGQNAENTAGFERTGNYFSRLPFRAQHRVLAAASGQVGSLLWLPRTSRLYLGRCEVCVGAERRRTFPSSIPCPSGECQNHTHSPAHLLCAWHQPGGARKEIGKKNIPCFWNSAAHFPSFAWLWHCPLEQLPETPAACPPVSPWPSSG